MSQTTIITPNIKKFENQSINFNQSQTKIPNREDFREKKGGIERNNATFQLHSGN